MSHYAIKPIDELETIHHGAVKLAGDDLGVRSFGIQVLEFPGGFSDYPEHDHAEEGQEEVYVVLDGSAQFVIDGEAVSVPRDHIVRIDPEARRKILPGPDGVKFLAIGCVVNSGYERPDGFRLAAQT